MGKSVIIGDIHLGIRQNCQKYLDFQLKWFYDELIPLLEKFDSIDNIFFLGDIFDSRVSLSPVILKAARKLFKDLVNRTNVHVITGNHDIYYRNHKDVHSLEMLEDIGCNVYNKISQFKINDKRILLLPWLTKDDEEKAIHMLVNQKFDICMGHLEINGMEKTKNCIEEEGLSNDIFSNCKHVFSGHFHLRRKDKYRDIQYTGTPYQLDWGDYMEEKGVDIIDMDTMVTGFKQSKETPRHLRLHSSNVSLDDIKDISNNFIKLTFHEGISEIDQINYIEKINSMEPLSFTFENEDSASFDTDGTILQNSIKDTYEFIKEYIDVVETPPNIKKEKLFPMVEAFYKRCF